MAQIKVSNLTFCYDGSWDTIFDKVSFEIDTDWKLGFVGRNGKGKTTFLKLLMGMFEYGGKIQSGIDFDYFPFPVASEDRGRDTIEIIEKIHPDYELWKICRELNLLQTDAQLLYRPFDTLSNGEQTKVMLALLFSEENRFLLIDEPTNHLDSLGRKVLQEYLRGKKGFILVSHDRILLDGCTDHVLVLNRTDITVEKGNFSSWWQNKQKKDAYEETEHERLKKEIGRLRGAAKQSKAWADKVEQSKIGYQPIKEDRVINTRSYLGEKSRKMQQRRKNLEKRQDQALEEKQELLKNVERPERLKLLPLTYHKELLIDAKELAVYYGERQIFQPLRFQLYSGEILALEGKNGCGKSSLIKLILGEEIRYSGILEVPGGLKISYVPQDASDLEGTLKKYAKTWQINQSLFQTILRKLDFSREQFEKRMEEYSSGQKKKVLLARSLCEQAHLYIWDEPMNFIDVFSRMQIEELVREFRPSMLVVEHDEAFLEAVGSKKLQIKI